MKRVLNKILVIFCLFASALTAKAVDHTVNIFASGFSPSSLNLNVGDTVTWVNQDDWPHTVSSTTGKWTPITLDSGQSFTLQFNVAGSFPYYDAFDGFNGSLSVTAVPVNTAPSVSITSPTNNAVIHAPATFTISATASDPGGSVASVQFLRGTTSLSTDTVSPYTANVSNLAAGDYTLYAVATDNEGAKSTNSVSIRVNSLPTISFITPTNGSLVAAPYTTLLQVNASDSDGTITNVQFSVGGSQVLGNDTTSPYSLTVSNLFAGTYAFQAMASDNNGGTKTATTTVTVINRPSLSGTAVTNGQVSFTVNNVPASRTIVVEASTDLGQWSPISTNVAPASPSFGVLTFTTNTSGNPKRFFRVQIR